MGRFVSYDMLRESHPCLSRVRGKTGRIHLPVSPVCNLACRYCKRSLSGNEDRPGTAYRILPVEEIHDVIEKAVSLCPEITTAGIAGPGEALASHHAEEAFKIVDRDFPDLIKCLSTNGLMLPEKAETLSKIHVNTVTVTVNSVDPDIQKNINASIFYNGRRIEGREAAAILIDNQLEGIRRASALGITVKINIVLIPGINEHCVEETAARVSGAGARICNIIPLIPQADMSKIQAPGCEETEKARETAGRYLDVFRHCSRCRADAVGKPGDQDLGSIIYGGRKFEEENFSHG